MTIRYVRVDLKPVRIETRRVFVPPPPPLPMRAAAAPPPATRSLAERKRDFARETRERAAVRARLFPTTFARDPHRQVRRKDPTAPVVTAEQLKLARSEARRTQRELADDFKCSRSVVAAAELGARTPLPAIARWTWLTLEARARRLAAAAEVAS